MLKKRISYGFLGVVLLALLSVQAQAAVSEQPPKVPSLAPMLERVLPAVVNISTRSRVKMQPNPLFNDPIFRQFFGAPNMPQEQEAQSSGSGVIVDAAKGYVITNNHVIDDAEEIMVTLRDRRTVKAKVVGRDPEVDVALLQIKADRLTALPKADSSQLRVGDYVVAIGNPFGLGQTVTMGIVSALGRSGLGIENYEDFIQTDASINPGNSGGALVDLRGQLVGINTAIAGPNGGNVGIGFAIPINMADNITRQLVSYGAVKRGQLGIMIQDLTPDLAAAFGLKTTSGVVVSQVMNGSSAARAGIRQGDVITAIDGKPLSKAGELRNSVGLQRVGTKVKLSFLRDGKPYYANVVIAEAKESRQQARTENSQSAAEVFKGATLGVREGHLQVTDVQPNSPAWNAGMRRGDILESVNRKPVHSIEDVRRAVKSASGALLINLRRGNGSLFIVIK